MKQWKTCIEELEATWILFIYFLQLHRGRKKKIDALLYFINNIALLIKQEVHLAAKRRSEPRPFKSPVSHFQETVPTGESSWVPIL